MALNIEGGVPERPGAGRRLRWWLADNHSLIVFTLLALAIRLVWNLRIHPPDDYVFSDMAGYVGRADRLLSDPLTRRVDEAFFPYGAHYLLAAVKAMFGKDNHAATAIYQALAGTLVVSFMVAMARRLSGTTRSPGRAWVAPIVGLVGALYYPLISLGGYYLSETPYSFFLAASAFLTLRLADEGRTTDAWLLGIVLGLGAAVRPQIVMGIPFLGVFWLLRRRELPRIRVGTLLRVALPLCLLLGLSTARAKYHTGRYSVVAQNGGVNRVFGRCHNVKTEARGSWFGPPPFGALLEYEKRHPGAWVTLDPAISTELKINGAMWEEDKMDALAARCVKKTGWLKQAHYAMNHVILLWAYNPMWPDMGQPRWRATMRTWNAMSAIVLIPPLAVALVLAFRRGWARHGLLSMQVFALLVVSMLYFGDTRFRTPYDPVIIVLAMDIYGRAAAKLVQLLASGRTIETCCQR